MEKKRGGGRSKTEENGVSVKMLLVAGGRLHCGGMFAGSTPTLQQEESEVPGGGWSHYAWLLCRCCWLCGGEAARGTQQGVGRGQVCHLGDGLFTPQRHPPATGGSHLFHPHAWLSLLVCPPSGSLPHLAAQAPWAAGGGRGGGGGGLAADGGRGRAVGSIGPSPDLLQDSPQLAGGPPRAPPTPSQDQAPASAAPWPRHPQHPAAAPDGSVRPVHPQRHGHEHQCQRGDPHAEPAAAQRDVLCSQPAKLSAVFPLQQPPSGTCLCLSECVEERGQLPPFAALRAGLWGWFHVPAVPAAAGGVGRGWQPAVALPPPPSGRGGGGSQRHGRGLWAGAGRGGRHGAAVLPQQIAAQRGVPPDHLRPPPGLLAHLPHRRGGVHQCSPQPLSHHPACRGAQGVGCWEGRGYQQTPTLQYQGQQRWAGGAAAPWGSWVGVAAAQSAWGAQGVGPQQGARGTERVELRHEVVWPSVPSLCFFRLLWLLIFCWPVWLRLTGAWPAIHYHATHLWSHHRRLILQPFVRSGPPSQSVLICAVVRCGWPASSHPMLDTSAACQPCRIHLWHLPSALGGRSWGDWTHCKLSGLPSCHRNSRCYKEGITNIGWHHKKWWWLINSGPLPFAGELTVCLFDHCWPSGFTI